jgi:signal transduction histidine kinase/ActR/RegA family two-component response regulator
MATLEVRDGVRVPGRRLLATWRGLTGSVRGRLALLTITLVLTAGLAAMTMIVDGYQAHTRTTKRQLSETANAMSLAVDGKVREVGAVLRVLAGSTELRDRDLEGFDREARRVVHDPHKWVILFDGAGRRLVNTAVPPGTDLSTLPPVPPALFDRYRHEVVGRELWASDLVPSAVGNRQALGLVMPVRRPGEPEWHVAIGMTPDVPQAVISDQNLPSGWYGMLLDRRGVTMARNVDPQRWVGRLAMPQTRPNIRGAEGVFESVTPEGRPTVVAYKRSPLTGWTFVVAMPRSEAREMMIRSLTLTGLLMLLLLGFGAGLAIWTARGIDSAVGALLRQAEAVGRGAPAPAGATGLSDTDAVADALRGASVRLKAREEELRRLNETLEARVAERTHELADATERLAQARKVEAMGRLTGGVAHDFNNLLTAVIGSLDLLKKRVTDERQAKFVAVAREAADRGARLTAQLLAFGRRQRLTPEPVDVNAVIEGTASLLHSALGAAVGVGTRLKADPAWAMADRTQLELVVMNLAINARDAMPEGGEVMIETDRRRVAKPSPQMEAPGPGEYVVVAVIDAGTGMTPEVLAQIWEPFFTTKPAGAGSGLGLSQVLGVVKQLGGGLEVDTAPGRGTTVRVFLPVAAPAEAAPVAAPSEAVDLTGVKVLLVDDDADVRRVTGDLLRELGCQPDEVADGRAALARLGSGSVPDVVVMDYAMPGMTGVECARRIAETRPDLPVLLISGFIDTNGLERTWTGPVLAKPFDRDTLAQRLAAALGSRRPRPREPS